MSKNEKKLSKFEKKLQSFPKFCKLDINKKIENIKIKKSRKICLIIEKKRQRIKKHCHKIEKNL